MRTLVAMLAGLLVLPSVALAQRQSDAEAAIRKAEAAFVTAWNAGDAAAIGAMYTEDAAAMPPGSEPVEGRAAIQAAMKGALEGAPGSQMAFKTVEVTAGDGWAVEVGSYVQTGADGSHQDHGRYVVLWKNVAGKWLLHRDIWNSSM